MGANLRAQGGAGFGRRERIQANPDVKSFALISLKKENIKGSMIYG